MADAGAAADSRLKVFISYSRKDDDFAQELLAGLQASGFQPYLDKHDVAAGEDWEARLGRLIETSDTVVFVMSPDAVASQRCAWEVERTHELKKRLLPIVWRGVEEAQVPPRLKQLNYIFFDRPHSFGPSMLALATALKTDIGWIREHTRIGEAALRWDGRGRAEELLMRGAELVAAKTWLAAQPKYAPEPTLLLHAFIRASEDAEVARASAERQRLDQMAAAIEREKAAQADRETALNRERAAIDRINRAQMAIGTLFACIIVIGVAWRFQAYLYEQYYWRFIMGPLVLTASQEKEKAAAPGSDFKECTTGCPTMVVVPAGKFTMGSPENEKDRDKDEGPQREVTITATFAVSKFEVTFDEWDTCVTAGACLPSSESILGRGNRPVMNVSWYYAKQYVTWLSRFTGKPYRLLTEAEWEYAARAGSTTAYSWGNEVGQDNANCSGCRSQWERKLAPVGSFKPNAFGLHDMHGNVSEWVQDCAGHYSNSPSDGTADRDDPKNCSRVIRGGSWASSPRFMRAAGRAENVPDDRRVDVGFRVARVLSPGRK